MMKQKGIYGFVVAFRNDERIRDCSEITCRFRLVLLSFNFLENSLNSSLFAVFSSRKRTK